MKECKNIYDNEMGRILGFIYIALFYLLQEDQTIGFGFFTPRSFRQNLLSIVKMRSENQAVNLLRNFKWIEER